MPLLWGALGAGGSSSTADLSTRQGFILEQRWQLSLLGNGVSGNGIVLSLCMENVWCALLAFRAGKSQGYLSCAVNVPFSSALGASKQRGSERQSFGRNGWCFV